MKQKLYIFGIVTSLIIFTGAILKVNHLAGAGIIITIGMATMILVFIPAALINNYKDEENRKNLSLYNVTWLTCIVVFTGMLFKMQHWPLTNLLLTIALPFPYVVFLPVFLATTSKNKNFNIYNTVFVLLLLALNSVFSCLLALNVSKTTMDDSYNLSRNYIRMEAILNHLPVQHQNSAVTLKIDALLKTVNEYQDLILEQEGLTREQWDKNPGNLLRGEAGGWAANALWKGHETFPGERLETQLKGLIHEFEISPGYEDLARSAPLIFNYTGDDSDGEPWINSILVYSPLAWSLIYLDGLETNLSMIKMSVTAID
jgi:hypothetical protein